MPEYMDENQDTTGIRGEVQPKEAVEEKVSLSDCFGLWLSFYPFDQNDYLREAAETGWPTSACRCTDTARHARAQLVVERGSRSGALPGSLPAIGRGGCPGKGWWIRGVYISSRGNVGANMLAILKIIRLW